MPPEAKPAQIGPMVLVVAAPAEARAVRAAFAIADAPPGPWTRTALGPGMDLIVTGIGKANAAGAVGRLARPGSDGVLVSVGVAGALPGPDAPGLGTVVVSSQSLDADEGLETPEGFVTCRQMGFPTGAFDTPGPPTSEGLGRWLAQGHGGVRVGPIATVSTCSGTDDLARRVRARTGAAAEAMEGAAVGLAASHLGLLFAEVRVISNTTGDRRSQVWDLPGALAALGRVIGPRERGPRPGA